MKGIADDLTEQRFGRLIVVKQADGRSAEGRIQWLCQCDCGKTVIVAGYQLKRGNTQSCGCLHSKHGKRHAPEYRVWAAMIQRCNNPKSTDYENYGGRGIKVEDERWLEFINFYLDMKDKPSPSYTLERIDNNKGYYKKNCKWATRKEQAQNQRPRKPKNIILNENPIVLDDF